MSFKVNQLTTPRDIHYLLKFSCFPSQSMNRKRTFECCWPNTAFLTLWPRCSRRSKTINRKIHWKWVNCDVQVTMTIFVHILVSAHQHRCLTLSTRHHSRLGRKTERCKSGDHSFAEGSRPLEAAAESRRIWILKGWQVETATRFDYSCRLFLSIIERK